MTIDSRLSYYTLAFYDHTGTRTYLFTRWAYLEFTQRLSDSWNANIRLEYSPENSELDFFRSTLERDFILEIKRVDPITGDEALVWEGFHRTLVDQVNQSGVVILTLYLTGYTQLLKRRIIIPADGYETSDQEDNAETCIRNYVDEQAINPTDTDRVITGLSNDTNDGVGDTAAYSARYTILYTALARLAEQGNVDFGVIKDTNVGTFLLRVAEIWGTDRQVGNVDDNAPTIFDITLNNMLIPILSKRGSNEVNHVYVGGQGQGTERTILEMEDSAAEAVSPWNRSEAFVDARNESSYYGLVTRGQSYLNQNQANISLTFNIQQTEGTRWVRDWNLGDIITAKYGPYTFTKKIIEVTISLSAGDTGQAVFENISAEMVDITNIPRTWRLQVVGRGELGEITYLGA